MNKIDALISQYCPAGVPIVRMIDIIDYHPCGALKRHEVLADGKYPVMNGGVDYSGYCDSYNYDSRVLTVSHWGSSAGHIHRHYNKFWANNACWIFSQKDSCKVSLVYLYYVLKERENDIMKKFAFGGATPNLSRVGFNNYPIPLPPLPVQKEIVRILDAMTNLVTNLDVEISARQKQYEHARERLICQQNYEQVMFESLGEIVRGKRFVRNDITESGTPCIHYGDMYTYYGVSALEARTHLQGEIVSKMRYAKKNDVIIVGAGENNEDIGVALAWLGDQPAAVHDACYIISHEQNPVYISQYTRTGMYHEQLKKIVVDGKICSFPLKGLAQLSIPLPPLSIQQEIVEKLDKVESLIQNLKAERDLRQKQYEYYREKLLLFAK